MNVDQIISLALCQVSRNKSIFSTVEYFPGKSQVRFPRVRYLGWDFHCNFPEKYSMVPSIVFKKALEMYKLLAFSLQTQVERIWLDTNQIKTQFHSSEKNPGFLPSSWYLIASVIQLYMGLKGLHIKHSLFPRTSHHNCCSARCLFLNSIDPDNTFWQSRIGQHQAKLGRDVHF